MSPRRSRRTRLRLATLHVLVRWDTHPGNVRETAKGKVSHFIASVLISQRSDRLVGERTRIVNRMKATLARLGVRNFKPTLRGPAPAKAGGSGASCNGAHPRGHAAAAKCIGRAAARHGAAGLCRQPDQGDRAGASETIGAGA